MGFLSQCVYSRSSEESKVLHWLVEASNLELLQLRITRNLRSWRSAEVANTKFGSSICLVVHERASSSSLPAQLVRILMRQSVTGQLYACQIERLKLNKSRTDCLLHKKPLATELYPHLHHRR